jgi:hypothetical protein
MNTFFGILTKSKQGWTWKDHLRWELKWSALELIAILAGLYLLLLTIPALSALGTAVLVAVLVEAMLVRSWHYRGT